MRSASLPLAILFGLAGLAGATVPAPGPAEVPADLLTAPEDLLQAVSHAYFPGDHDPTTPSGALRWRVWARHFPAAAAWAAAHHATAEWAHHHPERTRWALDHPASATFVLHHPDILEWQGAHPAEAQKAREARQDHADRAIWDELTGRTQGAVSDAAMAAATAPEATPDVAQLSPTKRGVVGPPPSVATAPSPAPAPSAPAVASAPSASPPASKPRFQVIQHGPPAAASKPRFEVRKPPAIRVIARREAPAPAPVVAPHPGTVVVHETVVVPAYQPAPVVLRTSPRLRYRYRPRIVVYRGHRGPRWGRSHRRHRGRGYSGRRGRHGRHRRWW